VTIRSHYRCVSGTLWRRACVGVLVLAWCLPALAGTGVPARSIGAVRTPRPPRLDGLLSDSCWQLATPASDFTQFDPEEGAPPTEETIVRLLYDDAALYVGVLCNDRDPRGITPQLSRRDRPTEADRFTVMIDSYFDRQTGFVFSTNVSGVQSDGVLSQMGAVYDNTWDAVWRVQTRWGRWGWSAEFAIPWSALRFTDRIDAGYRWGINFRRYISRKKETIEWVMVPRSERYSIPLWGVLTGVRGIAPSLHLEIAPFISVTRTSTTGNIAQSVPSLMRTQFGVDIKYGLARNFTLDATVNPDFGQVEVDAAVLNLTVFETLFPEKRPFFVEGAQMFAFGGAADNTPLTLFFSRRIGRQPAGSTEVVPSAGGTVEENPHVTSILGAAKLTGRTATGLSIAALTSLTDRENAVLWSPSGRSVLQTEPRASYSVIRLKQEQGPGSWVGGMATIAARTGLQPAVTGGVDWNLRFAGGKYTADGYLAGSRAPEAGMMQEGTAGRLLFMCVSAEHWFPAISFDFSTPRFSINDLGFFAQPHDHGGYVQLLYRENNAGGIFRRAFANINPEIRWNWDGVLTHAVLNAEVISELRNFWTLELLYSRNFPAYDDSEQGIIGLYRRPGLHALRVTVRTDERQSISGTIAGEVNHGDGGERGNAITTVLTVRPTAWCELSPAANYQRVRRALAWVYPDGNITDPVIGPMPFSLFGRRNLEQLDLSLRGTLTFTRTLSLQFFLQSLIARGEYQEYQRLAAADRLEPYDYPGDPSFLNHNFNTVTFNANVLFRWEYMPGSTIYLVWTQGRFGDSGVYAGGFGKRFGDTWRLPREDAVVLKGTYWFSL
jgi:hypothetical protein